MQALKRRFGRRVVIEALYPKKLISISFFMRGWLRLSAVTYRAAFSF
jgi:hypothetical protein